MIGEIMVFLDAAKLQFALTQGEILRRHYHTTQDLDSLNKAIEQFENVLRHPRLASIGNRQLVGFQNMTAQSLRARYERLGNIADLDRSIELYYEALLLSQRMHNQDFQASFWNNLAVGLSEKFRLTGDPSILNDAVESARQAVESIDLDSPDYPKHLNTRALRYRDRYQVFRKLSDLEQAIQDFRRALSLMTSPEFQATVQHNLSAALAERFERYKDARDAEEAILRAEQALENTREGTHEYLQSVHSLSLRVHLRFLVTQDVEDLNQSINHLQYVLNQVDANSPLYDIAIRNLANFLSEHFHATRNRPDLERAIQLTRESVERTSLRSPIRAQRLADLGQRWNERYQVTGDEMDWQTSKQNFREACELGLRTDPYAALKSSRAWGDGSLLQGEWDIASVAYTFGVDAIDQLYQVQLDRSDKESWLREAVGLHANLAYACARLDRLEDAIAYLEHGRAFILSEQLELRRAVLERLPSLGYQKLYDRYQHSRVRRILVQNADVMDTIDQAQAELQHIIAEIRRIDGFHDFFVRPEFFNSVLPAIPESAAHRLVYTAVTPIGGLALVISPGGRITPIWLEALNDATVRQYVLDYRDSYEWRLERPATWRAAIDRITRWLWDALVGPIIDSIQSLQLPDQKLSHLVFIPQGWLGFLPVHAAWSEISGDGIHQTRRQYALDNYLITYAPNARSLKLRQASLAQIDNLCAVGNPDTTLQFADAEISWALSHFPDRCHRLVPAAATHANVIEGLTHYSLTHFATHGWCDVHQPLNSCLYLKDENLTLRDILDLILDDYPRLAILSACETGMPTPDLPDEVISLGTGLLQAGLVGVVSSLWAVSDVSTMLLMSRMYSGWTQGGLSPADALRHAQYWLRTASQSELTNMFQLISTTLSSTEREHFQSAVLATRLGWAEDYPYSHPYYWAAFTFTGTWS
jgi:CHAT domain-containing protein